jgi:hypothetical protein
MGGSVDNPGRDEVREMAFFPLPFPRGEQTALAGAPGPQPQDLAAPR